MADRFPIPNLQQSSSADERALLDRLHELKQEGKTWKDKVLTRVDGRDDEDDLAVYRGDMGQKKDSSMFGANFVQAFIDRLVAQLTDNRPILRIEHRKVGLDKTAHALQKIVLGVWQEFELQRQIFKMCHNAAVTRSAGLYTGYDSVNDEIYFEILRLKQILIDPTAIEAGFLDRAEYCIIERIKPVSDLIYRFPGRGALVKNDVAMTTALGGRKLVDSPVTTLIRSSKSPQSGSAIDRARVWEALVQDRQISPSGKPLFPNGRQILFTKDVILSDGPNPYWDGVWPIDWFDWAVDPEHPWGISAPSLLWKIQRSFDELINGTVENSILSNFLQVIGDADAITDKGWKSLQQIRNSLVIRKQSTQKQFTIQPPAPFPTDRALLAKQLFTFAQLLMGVTDVTLGETPGSLQSGQAIEGLQEGANLMTRARASRLEDFLTRVGNKIVARIFQFMPSDRVFSFLGPTGEALSYAFNRQELFLGEDKRPLTAEERREFFRYLRFSILPGSSAPGTRLRRAEMMVKLHTLGAASRKAVLQAADIQDPENMLKEAEEDFKVFPPPGFKRDQSAVNRITGGPP